VRPGYVIATTLAIALALGSPAALGGCGNASSGDATETAATASAAALADGTYDCEVTTDSSMFHADSCTLEVEGGAITAHLTLPGEGFSRLFFGTAEEAATAPDAEIFDYYLNDDGKYTFDLPVEALDTDLAIAAFGHRRDTWYDHTISFATPAG